MNAYITATKWDSYAKQRCTAVGLPKKKKKKKKRGQQVIYTAGKTRGKRHKTPDHWKRRHKTPYQVSRYPKAAKHAKTSTFLGLTPPVREFL